VRYTPDSTALACLDGATNADKWCALESGTHDFLKLNEDTMTFEWVTDVADSNPDFYKASEGIHYEDGIITIALIVIKQILRT
jgi:hypothetical protein